MSEELTIQGGDSQEDVTIERTIEVSIDKNGLGIESGQVFPSVTVDFAPIIAPASVHWGDIIGKPDPVTNVFYNSREADFEYETFDGQGDVIISRDRLKEILDVPTNAVNVYPYGVNFDDLKVGDVVLSFDGEAGIVREKDDFGLVLCSYDYARVFSSYYEKHEGEWVLVDATETPIRLEAAEVGNFVSIDENGNISDSGSKASDFITQHQDLSGKADKVSNATSGNFAGLDDNGNLTDSGHKHSDYLTSHQDISGKEDKTNKVTSLSSSSTDTQYPSAKAVYDQLANSLPQLYSEDVGNESARIDASLIRMMCETFSINDGLYTYRFSYDTGLEAVSISGELRFVVKEDHFSVKYDDDWELYFDKTIFKVRMFDGSDPYELKFDLNNGLVVGSVNVSGKIDDLEQEKADMVTGATAGDFAGLDAYGNLTDSGYDASDFATASQGTKADNAIPMPSGGSTGQVLKKTSDGVEWANESGGGGTATDVQINGTSITSNGVANIITEGTYNASTNKIATMSDLPSVSGKADKVSGATNGNLAALDSNGNLTDSGYDASDFPAKIVVAYVNNLSSEQVGSLNVGDIVLKGLGDSKRLYTVALKENYDGGMCCLVGFYDYKMELVYYINDDGWNFYTNTEYNIGNCVQKSNTVGLLKNDGTVDTTQYGTYSKPASGIPASDLASGVIPSVPVQDVTVGGTSVVSSGTAVIPAIPDVTGKADKVASATNGNFAGLDSNGNLTDSGSKASDFLTSHQDISVKEDKTNKVTSLSSSSTDTQYPSAKVVYDQLATKQATLVSGTNIKTINSTSLLGTGDLALALQSQGISSITSQQDGSIVFTFANGDTTTIDLNHTHPNYYKKVAETTQPQGGFLPDVVYSLGTLTGSVTFAMASAVTGNVNHYFWMFDTSSTAPTITWPSRMTWQDSAPTISASKHYEISVLNDIAMYLESNRPTPV